MKLDTIYVIHHSHTDIGFTIDQPIFWELQARFLYDALELVDRHRGAPPDAAFRWTVETTCQLEPFLRSASRADIDRLVRAEAEGFVEVTAMFANLSPLADLPLLRESLAPARRLRGEYGFDIRYAMNCDVNGHNWPLADLLLDEGIEGFSMAVNHHFGGPPEPRPDVFLWRSPSGRLLPTLNGWEYSKAWDFGLGAGGGETFTGWLPRIEAYLNSIGYPLTFIALQGMHPFGDNGSAWGGYAEFARRWNEAGGMPRIVCATPRTFWKRVAEHRGALATRAGDWTDYWAFGCASAARETAIARTSRDRLLRADAAFAALQTVARDEGAPQMGARRSHALYRDEAWRDLALYAEHTWGDDEAATSPEIEDTLSVDCHKKATAYALRSLSLLLERDALADLSRSIERRAPDDLLLFNHLPWPRVVCGPVARNVVLRRGLPEDSSASRHSLGRGAPPTDSWTGREGSRFNSGMGLYLPPTELPAFGYAVVRTSSLAEMRSAERSDAEQVENPRYRLRFDAGRGGIVSLYDKTLRKEWVDSGAGLAFCDVIHEEPADRLHPEPRKLFFHMDWTPRPETVRCWKPGWKARREGSSRALLHAVYRLPFATIVEQITEHPRLGRIHWRVFLPDYADWIELQSEWLMGTETRPEATYVALPFDLPGAQARFDSGGMPVRAGIDQLPGVNRDYFAVQGWVDFNDGQRGVTVATPVNPMVQLGSFHFADDQREFRLERATMLGWVTNNYWETNFPVRQPGTVVCRYAVLPYAGPFDLSRSSRLAAEYAHSAPVPQPMCEPPAEDRLPSSGSFLRLPEEPILTLSVRAEPRSRGMILELWNASEKPARARVSSALLRIAHAEVVGACGAPGHPLAVEDGAAQTEIPPYRLATVRLETTRNRGQDGVAAPRP